MKVRKPAQKLCLTASESIFVNTCVLTQTSNYITKKKLKLNSHKQLKSKPRKTTEIGCICNYIINMNGGKDDI